MSLLITGGASDPNLICLLHEAKKAKVKCIDLLTSPGRSPSFSWDINTNTFSIGKSEIKVHSVFIRNNVFGIENEKERLRMSVWYATFEGVLMSHKEIHVLNRESMGRYTNKLHVLHEAKKQGFSIPYTVITNSKSAIPSATSKWIAKPVMGGGYCEGLDDALSKTIFNELTSANPAIVQHRINGEDIRIYRIGEEMISFVIKSDSEIDYRRSRSYDIRMKSDIPSSILNKTKLLMDQMGLNWGAVDFKREENSDTYYFLEVNSNPMFSVFDKVANNDITKAILMNLHFLHQTDGELCKINGTHTW